MMSVYDDVYMMMHMMMSMMYVYDDVYMMMYM